MYEVEAVANNDKRQLIGKFSLLLNKYITGISTNKIVTICYVSKRLRNDYLEEIFYSLSIVTVGFATNTFHFLDLTRLTRSLNILEVHFWVLTEVDNRTQKVK